MPYKDPKLRPSTKDKPPEWKAKVAARQQAWRLRQIEKSKETSREYYKKNSERIRDVNRIRPCAPGKPDKMTCKKCSTVYDYTDLFFNKSTVHKWKLVYECKACMNQKQIERRYFREYGITYDKAQKLKDYPCAICGEQSKAIDHCHKTGKIRSALCNGCNMGLGGFRDRPNLLRLAAEYLEMHSEEKL